MGGYRSAVAISERGEADGRLLWRWVISVNDSESRRPEPAREVLLGALLDKVAQDRFPSTSMLDLIERMLRPDEVDIYVRILVDKVRHERFPSFPVLRRLVELTE